MTEISLNNVSKSFGAVNVIDEISLDVHSGEFIVFLGLSLLHISELTRPERASYAASCVKKKNIKINETKHRLLHSADMAVLHRQVT